MGVGEVDHVGLTVQAESHRVRDEASVQVIHAGRQEHQQRRDQQAGSHDRKALAAPIFMRDRRQQGEAGQDAAQDRADAKP